VETVRATYLPTEKNGLVRELLPALGFSPAPSDDYGAHYTLTLTAASLAPLQEQARCIEAVSAAAYATAEEYP
jgi:hypothetical protein